MDCAGTVRTYGFRELPYPHNIIIPHILYKVYTFLAREESCKYKKG